MPSISFMTDLFAIFAFVAWIAHYFANRKKMKGKDLEALKKLLTSRGIMVFLCVMMLINNLCLLAGTEPMARSGKFLLVVWLILTSLNGWSLWEYWKKYKTVKAGE